MTGPRDIRTEQRPFWVTTIAEAPREFGDRRRLCLVGVADVKQPRAASGHTAS
jgi:hypothetical protein